MRCRVPDAITISRMVAALLLLGVVPFSAGWFALYLWCGISDGLDGWLARYLKVGGAAGARLDSIADLVRGVGACKLRPGALLDVLDGGVDRCHRGGASHLVACLPSVCVVVCVVASLSAAEELLLMARMPLLDRDVRSIVSLGADVT